MPCKSNTLARVIESRNEEAQNTRLRKEVPISGIFAPYCRLPSKQLPSEQLTSEQLPSESDSVCRLRRDDLAVIHSEEPLLNIGELSRKTRDPQHEVEYAVLKAASEGRWEEINQVFNTLGQQERVLHAQNEFGWSPLHFAVYYGHLKIVNPLVNVCRLPPEQKTKDGRTPLMVAAGAGHLPVAKLLLETHQSNVNEEDSKSATPVMYAARRGHLPVVKVLWEQGADVLHKAEESVTALHLAAYGDSLECVEYLMPLFGEKRFEMDENGRTCLHYAVWGGSLQVMRYLVEWCEFDLGLTTADGRTPLMLAANAGHLQVAKYLVEEYKCKVYEEDSEGSATALHLAAYGGSIECVKYLSPLFGDRKFEMDENQWTCLHHAVAGGSVRVVEYLVDECEFYIDRRTTDGLTPLMLAAQFGSLSVAKLLVEKYECDVNEQSGEKKSTPMMFAAQYGHRPIVELLVDHGADVFQEAEGKLVALHHAAYGGSIECVKYLLPLFEDRKFKADENGLTCLHWAVLGGSLTVVRYLVDQWGFDLRLRATYGFLLACEEGHREIVRELLKRDEVDRNAVDKDGHGALHLANKGGHAELVQMLVQEFGFPPDTSDNVSNLQAEGGSDPSEREDTSNLLTDEAALKRHCWIPFDIKTVSIEAKGGILCLEPQSDDVQEMKEDAIFVEVPPDAVSTSANVEMRYAIIPSGSFTLPVGYQFGSPVVYIYYDSRRVTKPLALHLPHWYGGEDHAGDGLSFAVASHSLKRGTTAYQFQLIEGGTFSKHQQYGIFFINGHSTLFADVFKEKTTSVYLATQWEQRLANKAHTKIVITYFSKVWPKIVAKYWKGWKQNKHTSPTQFQFAGSWLSWLPLSTKSRVCGQLTCRHGQEWAATLVGANTVNQEDIAFRKKYNEQELEDLVAEGLYPPAIHCAVTYSTPPDFEHVSLETLEVVMTGTDRQQVTFPVELYEAKGEFSLKKRSSESTQQDQPPAKRVVRSGGSVDVSTSAPGLSRQAVAAQRSPPICEATMHPWNKDALRFMREELGGVIMVEVGMSKKLEKSDILRPGNKGFLSREQLQVVESLLTPAGQMNKVIDYLLEMEDKYFEDFCHILEQSNFEGKAKRLRERAKVFKNDLDAQEAARIAALSPPPGDDSNDDSP